MYKLFLLLMLPLVYGCSGKSPQTTSPSDGAPNVGSSQDFTISAGADQVVPEKTQIILSGEVTPAPADVVYFYSWEPAPGSEGAVQLTNANRISAFFLAPSVKTPTELEFDLTVEDVFGVSQTDRVKVRVNPVNEPPKIQLDDQYSYLETDEVFVEAKVSDEDGVIQSMSWEQTGGPAVVVDDSSGTELRFTPPNISVGVQLVFRFTAVDDEGGKTQKTTLVSIDPVLMPPVVSVASPEMVQSFTKVVLVGEVTDPDGKLVSLDWEQFSGPSISLERLDDASVAFVAPNVSEAADVTISLTATDSDGLQTRQFTKVNILPQISFNVSGFVAFGPDQRVAAVEARRIVEQKVLAPAVSETALSEGPLGSFVISLPGAGLYELSARVVLASQANVDNSQVVLKSIVDIESPQSVPHINILTHIASALAIEDKNLAEDQVAQNLNRFIGLPEAPFDKLHIFSVDSREGSAYLMAATELLRLYSNSAATIKFRHARLAGFLEFLPYQLGDIVSEHHFAQGIQSLVKDIDPIKLNFEYRNAASSIGIVFSVDVEDVLDSDLDGVSNTWDFDDDGDGEPDSVDSTRLGYRFTKPNCQNGNIADIFTTDQTTFNIANRWKPEHYVHTRSGQLQSGTIISPIEVGARWKVRRTQLGGDTVLEIILLENEKYLSVVEGVKLDLTEPNLSELEERQWIVEKAYPNNPVKLYHLRNRAHPELYLSTLVQTPLIDGFDKLYLDRHHQDGAWASQWGFCEAEPEPVDLGEYIVSETPHDFLDTACASFKYSTPSFLEDKVYQIQSILAPQQYLNTIGSLKSSPLLNTNNPRGQWQIIGLPLESSFLIKSMVDEALYLASSSTGELHLSYSPYTAKENDALKWILEADSLDSFAIKIRHATTGLFLNLNQAALDGLTVSHDIQLFSEPGYWRFCEVPAP